MSGLRPHEMKQFYDRLHARDLDTAKLATLVGRSRARVTEVLNGSRRRGPVWDKLVLHLHPEEVALLDVVQCASWNKKRLEKRPRWTPEKQRILGEVSP